MAAFRTLTWPVTRSSASCPCAPEANNPTSKMAKTDLIPRFTSYKGELRKRSQEISLFFHKAVRSSVFTWSSTAFRSEAEGKFFARCHFRSGTKAPEDWRTPRPGGLPRQTRPQERAPGPSLPSFKWFKCLHCLSAFTRGGDFV